MLRFFCMLTMLFCFLQAVNFLDFASTNSGIHKDANLSVQKNENPQRRIKIPTH
ncbi:hypothetical protein OQH60_05015 [Campylobacter sp. MIT 21-1685]|uniref:hypothetical protein n=1 Tax=unclassified Campylobacter TaxID=2593542 RepID=UPI00224B4F1F|nr:MULTISPECIES: hypothetical protein [unclassified Campylobacter]MCX2683225.1 hypothetical protein [Campylobacter sp. MIT 21-1684]MCX2751455.1 hypothetical protein [Campylobacter sp. MIT 21-1682]MCX2807706.1 hypothetical protein [Campylobacter sp. MIT 21-1685]